MDAKKYSNRAEQKHRQSDRATKVTCRFLVEAPCHFHSASACTYNGDSGAGRRETMVALRPKFEWMGIALGLRRGAEGGVGSK